MQDRDGIDRDLGMRGWPSRLCRAGIALCALPLLAGCLNPQTVNSLVGGLYPIAPGNTPFLAVRVINNSKATLDQVPIVYDNGSSAPPVYYISDLSPEAYDTGILLQWPVYRLAIGSLTDPYLPSIQASFTDIGSTTTAPFGHPALVAGVDYNSGDTIIFEIVGYSQSQTYLTVGLGRIEGASQGPSFREDPFVVVWQLLATKGFLDVVPLGGGT